MTRNELIQEVRNALRAWDGKTVLPLSKVATDILARHPGIDRQDFGAPTFNDAVARIAEYLLRQPNGSPPTRIGTLSRQDLASEIRDTIREARWLDDRLLGVSEMVAAILKHHPDARNLDLSDLAPSFEEAVAVMMSAEYDRLGADNDAEANALRAYLAQRQRDQAGHDGH